MSLGRYLRSNPLNLLVLGLPLALAARQAGMSDVIVFVLSGLAIVPLAGLGDGDRSPCPDRLECVRHQPNERCPDRFLPVRQRTPGLLD